MKRGGAALSPSSALETGVNALRSIDGLDVLEGPTWDLRREHWLLRCRITVPTGTDLRVPVRTSWYVLVDEAYPAGCITIYPASNSSITDTFHHQHRNTPAPADQPWRGGDICVHQGARALGRLGGTTEPLEAPARLAWRLGRAVAWVRAASTGTLVGPGDLFELPDFGGPVDHVFGFSEDASSFRLWNSGVPNMGTADLYTASTSPESPMATVVRRYCSMLGDTLYEPRWGKVFEPTTPNTITPGVWVRLPKVPHLTPWKAPETWGELLACVSAAGVNLDELVAAASARIRATRRGWLLCGFPMPARVGEPDVEYFWQALLLPRLASSEGELKGFRNTEANRRSVDRLMRFHRDAKLAWVRSENWHPTTRSVRGRFSIALTDRRVLVIGGGALGSTVAELLVRGGVEELTICDSQPTLAGNLARHTLTLRDVGKGKAVGLTERLNQVSPHARVEALLKAFPPSRPDDVARARQADLVIDCTGEDEVALAMATFDWQRERTFWSLALDWQARRSFSFLTRGDRFPADGFLRAVRAQLDGDPQELAGRELGHEGVGCWHPVMPARSDHVWVLASVAVSDLDDSLRAEKGMDQLVIFERDDATPSAGVRRVG